jgi:proteic killer suppression protein
MASKAVAERADLDSCIRPDDMKLPGFSFHQLKGKRQDGYAVSGNWRITFKFDGENAIVVDLEDYP